LKLQKSLYPDFKPKYVPWFFTNLLSCRSVLMMQYEKIKFNHSMAAVMT